MSAEDTIAELIRVRDELEKQISDEIVDEAFAMSNADICATLAARGINVDQHLDFLSKGLASGSSEWRALPLAARRQSRNTGTATPDTDAMPKFTWMKFESIDGRSFDLHVDDQNRLYLAVRQEVPPQTVRVRMENGTEVELHAEAAANGFILLTGPLDLVTLREEIAGQDGRIRAVFLP